MRCAPPFHTPSAVFDDFDETGTVHHHFDYEIDGHQRTYKMHSEGPHKVWLTREEDESKIPYTVDGQPIHYGMTLISILRLGVTDEIRDELYASFLQMSLYEDMAPWNIFYEAGKLIYIDYDTRNLVFDEAVKTAYQVLLCAALGSVICWVVSSALHAYYFPWLGWAQD